MRARSKMIVGIAFALFLIFGSLYLFLGMELAQHPFFFADDDVFFGADHLEPFEGWTHLRGEHYHDGAHPLLTLVAVPLATLLSALLKSRIYGILVLNAGFAALMVALAYLTFYQIARRPWHSLAPAFFFGFSMSQLVFGSVPETYAMAGATLAVTYLLAVRTLQKSAVPLLPWVAAGILSFAILITNVGQTLITYGLLSWSKSSGGVRWLWIVGRYLLIVLLSVMLLSLLQQALLPTSQLFFQLDMFREQSGYMDAVTLFGEGSSVITNMIAEVVKNFFVVNLVGIDPQPVIIENRPDIRFAYYQARLQAGRTVHMIGLVAMLLWAYLLVEGLVRNLMAAGRRAYMLIFGAIVLYNIGLYALFNRHEMFLYSTTYTLPVILLCIDRTSITSRPRLWLWIALAAATGVNNLQVFQRFSLLLGNIY